MKKLMTTLSAIVVAFGLHAVGMADTGTSFEGLTGDAAYDIFATGDTPARGGELIPLESEQTYWVTNATDEALELKVIAGTSVEVSSKRPAQYEYAQQSNYLRIKTTLGKPITRNANVDGSSTSIGDGFYFDSLVKFTAFDSDPTIELGADGKLAIWLKEELDGDIPVATNLVLTAGFIDESLGAKVVQTNYSCVVDSSINLCDGGWHRVTVKAIDNIYTDTPVRPGFVVFIDGKYVMSGAEKGIVAENLTPMANSYNQDGAVFPSAVQIGSDSVKRAISSVSFDGQGDVDDLVFTATAPAFADVKFYALRLGENVTSATYVAKDDNGDTYDSGTLTAASPSKSIDYKAGMYVIVSDVQYAAGYMSNGVAGVGPDSETGYYKPAEPNQYTEFLAKAAGASVNGEPYETLADAVKDIGNLSGTDFEVVLSADADASGGLAVDASGKRIVLDLAGYDIVGDGSAMEVINVASGTALEITNSTVEVGHVVSGDAANEYAIYCEGDLTIGAGMFDGTVDVTMAQAASITGGGFTIADNGGTDIIAALNAAVALGCGSTYWLAPESGESPTYYVVTEKAAPTNWTVTFYGFDGVTVLGTDEVENGATVTSAPECPIVAGYSANGWLLNDQAFDLETPVTSDLALYANYEAVPYTIYFLKDDGTAFAHWATGYVVTNSYTIEDAVVLPTVDNIDLQGVGVTFDGWTNATGTVTGWAAGATGDVTVYAKLDPVVPTTHPAGEEFDPPAGKTAAAYAAEINSGVVSKADLVRIPSGVTGANATTYLGLLCAVADGEKVSFQLTAEAVTTVQTAVNAAATGLPLTSLAAGNLGVEASISALPGLYYSVSCGSSLTGMTEILPRQLATETGTVTIPVSKQGDAGFYQVNVNLTAE